MKILIADDEITSRLLLSAAVKKLGHDVAAARDGKEAWELIEKESFSMLISDWMMPDIDGLELCRRIRSRSGGQYLYTILITALGGRENYLDAMDAGADDFITKPLDVDQLAARVRVAQRILELQERLRTLALYDSLTGLLNRAAILETLSQELNRTAREAKPLGVVLCDLDHFKQINDTHGHQAGDDVLRETARRMGAALRSYDSVGRYGGEEFLMVLPGCADKDAAALAERVRLSISGEPVTTVAGNLAVTSSFGIAISGPGFKDSSALIRTADVSLYQAKAEGRNCIRIAQTDACA